MWLSHTLVPDRNRAGLIQGPLSSDGLFGPQYAEVLMRIGPALGLFSLRLRLPDTAQGRGHVRALIVGCRHRHHPEETRPPPEGPRGSSRADLLCAVLWRLPCCFPPLSLMTSVGCEEKTEQAAPLSAQLPSACEQRTPLPYKWLVGPPGSPTEPQPADGPSSPFRGVPPMDHTRYQHNSERPCTFHLIRSTRQSRAHSQDHADNHAVPSHCEVGRVLGLLQSLLEALKVYAAAVSAGHAGCDGKPVFSHPVVKRFLQGARPIVRGLAPHWDHHIVLRGLSGAPFVPLAQAPLDALLFKMGLLLVLVLAKRAGELTALCVSPSCLLLNRDSSFALLRPNPAFLPKNISRDIVLKAFHPPPHSNESETELDLLCPVWALMMYVQHSAAFRSTKQLFVCYSDAAKDRALSKQRLP
ncbi:hypothetical protein N1851_003774 [Merluccius polli]|uniref:Uncharacterized protein n=1 Tax=Merluccius polli TaxID=89951 RepID=A0AA47N924_MERPO|nr:hypothetical protein N1851_003774 [Merluccius polli]